MNNKSKYGILNPNNKLMNPPKYAIHGEERRKMRKELSLYKSIVETFWRDHQMEKDMGYCMSDSEAQIIFDDNVNKVKEMEELLSKPYLPIYREERLSKILDKK